MARFTRMGQTLLVTGVPMLDMLAIAAEGVNNAVVAEEITRAAGKVQSGKALSAALQTEDYILPMVPQMIKIGEQSGRIDEMMGKTAQAYEDELDEEIQAIFNNDWADYDGNSGYIRRRVDWGGIIPNLQSSRQCTIRSRQLKGPTLYWIQLSISSKGKVELNYDKTTD